MQIEIFLIYFRFISGLFQIYFTFISDLLQNYCKIVQIVPQEMVLDDGVALKRVEEEL